MWGGTSASDFHRFTRGLPPTKSHTYWSKLPNSSCTFRNAFALRMVDSIFSPVADDALVFHERFDLARVITSDEFRVELAEGSPIPVAARENRVPAQAGLRAFEIKNSKSTRSS